MKLTVGTKIGLGFAIVFVLMLASSLLTYYKVQANRAVEDYILNIRFPTIQADYALDADLQKTQLRTRDAILHAGDRSALEANRQSYGQAVQAASEALGQLKEFSRNWVLQENRDRLARIETTIPRLQEIQRRIFTLADDGSPAAVKEGIQVLFTEAKPTNDAMLKDLSDQEVSMMTLLNQRERVMLEAAGRSIVLTISIATLLAIVLGVMTALFIGRKISGATSSLLGQAKAIAAGDLTQEELQATSHDELGDLTIAINRMQMRLRDLIASITENAQNVANASEEFSAVSQQISANSQETSAQAGTVSAATEEVNRNLQTVATATEEMSATVQEIAKNASEAAKIAAEAMKTAAETNAVVGKLGDSSAEIGQVIKVITSIAQKTDLLALNATVEAARAGEAGAGFAVVANEVKELAKQTATATEDISKRIEAIQVDAKSAVQAIKSISGIIDKVNSISSTIATAVEEQSATTAEMSRNLSEAAKGSGEVAQNIHGVAQAAQNTSQGSTDSLKAAKSLAEMSTQLRELVGQFKIDGRASGNGSHFPRSSWTEQQRSSRERTREEVLAD